MLVVVLTQSNKSSYLDMCDNHFAYMVYIGMHDQIGAAADIARAVSGRSDARSRPRSIVPRAVHPSDAAGWPGGSHP